MCHRYSFFFTLKENFNEKNVNQLVEVEKDKTKKIEKQKEVKKKIEKPKKRAAKAG